MDHVVIVTPSVYGTDNSATLEGWMKIAPFLALGQMTREDLITSVGLFPVALASTWAGVLLVRRFSAERLARVLYLLLFLIGLKLVYDGVSPWLPQV